MAELSRKTELEEWAIEETRSLDLVASWESLCDTYKALAFVDPISDGVRLEEFRWIIREMNKHLTRARKRLLSCKDLDSMMGCLSDMFTPAGDVKITGRRELAYQKLRQSWVRQMMAQVSQMMEQEKMENG